MHSQKTYIYDLLIFLRLSALGEASGTEKKRHYLRFAHEAHSFARMFQHQLQNLHKSKFKIVS